MLTNECAKNSNVVEDRLSVLAHRATNICIARQWARDWQRGGVYLHLEASEFIEALRGKGGDPADEAGDVLFVLLSTLLGNGYTVEQMVSALEAKMDKLEVNVERYAGEQVDA